MKIISGRHLGNQMPFSIMKGYYDTTTTTERIVKFSHICLQELSDSRMENPTKGDRSIIGIFFPYFGCNSMS